MKKILVLGAGSFAHLVALSVRDLQGPARLEGFVVDDEYFKLPWDDFLDLPVYPASRAPSECMAVSGIVSTRRAELSRKFNPLKPALIRREATVRRYATAFPGSFVNSGAVIDVGAAIHYHVIVNRGAQIGHDVFLGACSTVGPGAVLCGGVVLGEQVYVGAGAVILENLSVGQGSIVGAGAVVTKDVPPRCKVMGVPARIMEREVEPL